MNTICAKGARRLYYLKQLRCALMTDLLYFYLTVIRPLGPAKKDFLNLVVGAEGHVNTKELSGIVTEQWNLLPNSDL